MGCAALPAITPARHEPTQEYAPRVSWFRHAEVSHGTALVRSRPRSARVVHQPAPVGLRPRSPAIKSARRRADLTLTIIIAYADGRDEQEPYVGAIDVCAQRPGGREDEPLAADAADATGSERARSEGQEPAEVGEAHRCTCGSLLARLVPGGVELKCRGANRERIAVLAFTR